MTIYKQPKNKIPKCKYCNKEMKFYYSSNTWGCYNNWPNKDCCQYIQDLEGNEIYYGKYK